MERKKTEKKVSRFLWFDFSSSLPCLFLRKKKTGNWMEKMALARPEARLDFTGTRASF
jgi:hypothetical protein